MLPSEIVREALEKSYSSIPQKDSLEKSHPVFLDALFNNFNYDFEAISKVMDPVLTVQNRCQLTHLYIHGILAPTAVFLGSNTSHYPNLELTTVGSSWLIGNDPHCAILLEHRSVDPGHAVIGYQRSHGFYVMDLGSRQGTCLNRRRLDPHTRRRLRNGDMLQFGVILVEFFIDDFEQRLQIEPTLEDTTLS
ncbi:MAG: FHA domain-containing protein [Cyanobacteria bacterium P01_A01_bin.114]